MASPHAATHGATHKMHSQVHAIHGHIQHMRQDIGLMKATHVASIVMSVAIAALCGVLMWAVWPLHSTLTDIKTRVDTQDDKLKALEARLNEILTQTTASTTNILAAISSLT